jgi:hypothetical protein
MTSSTPADILHTSEFSDRTAFTVFYTIIGIIGTPAAVWYLFTGSDAFDIIGGTVALIILLTIAVTMIRGELRKKALRIYFKHASVEVKPYLGFGRKITYNYADIKGFVCGLQPALPAPYECITLSTANKNIQIAQFYFRNYKELKQFVSETFDNKGRKQYSLATEFKESFKN